MDWPLPDAEERREFEEREPAFGLTVAQIDALDAEGRSDEIPPVVQRRLLRRLKWLMKRQLISVDGCATVADLCEVLRAEATSGVPAPVPAWYKWSTVIMGPRKIGYDTCDNRGCFRCETVEESFRKCSQCRLPHYCSKECQTQDWKLRHKRVCKEAAKSRDQVANLGKLFGMMSDASADGGSSALGDILKGRLDHDTKKRIKGKKAERKKEARR